MVLLTGDSVSTLEPDFQALQKDFAERFALACGPQLCLAEDGIRNVDGGTHRNILAYLCIYGIFGSNRGARAGFVAFASPSAGIWKTDGGRSGSGELLIRGLDWFWRYLRGDPVQSSAAPIPRVILRFLRFNFRCFAGGIRSVSSAIDNPICRDYCLLVFENEGV